jgi:predicted nucleic acid-binding protein
MRLVADASVLVGELLRVRGRALLTHPQVEWMASEEVASEVRHELARRTAIIAQRSGLRLEDGATLAREALQVFAAGVVIVPHAAYEPYEALARSRIVDTSDWSPVALALVLEVGIWTEDNDFCGLGLPTWRTRVLLEALGLAR